MDFLNIKASLRAKPSESASVRRILPELGVACIVSVWIVTALLKSVKRTESGIEI